MSALAAPVPARRPGLGRWSHVLAVVALNLLSAGLLFSGLPAEARLAGALLLFVGLPGALFVQAVFGRSRAGAAEWWLLALGSGCVLATLLALVLHGLCRPIHPTHLLLGAGLLNGGLLVAVLARRAVRRPPLARPGWPLLAVLIIAALPRLAYLGYSEFHSDEAKVALRAMAVLQGVPDALIAHRKPPGEVLFAALFGGGVDSITELVGRLPFALASIAAVVAVYHLGRVLFGTRAGLIAALLLAVNGYWVAFGRVLQYQGVGLLFDLLAVLCLFRFARAPTGRVRYAVVGALLLAGSVLMASSAVFLLPVAAVALWPWVIGRRASRAGLVAWLWPLLLLVPIAAVVYGIGVGGLGAMPGAGPSREALGLENFWKYFESRLGGGQPYFNLDQFVVGTSQFASSLYLLVVGVGGLGALAWGLRSPGSSARRSLGSRLALVWLAGPLLTHLLLVQVPWAHWREVFPGLVLLVGAAAAAVYARLTWRPARLGALLAAGLFLVACGHYIYVAWIRPWPEYILTYPAGRHPLDWTAARTFQGGSNLGAARHHGWKAVAALMSQGALPAEYATAQRPEAAWYLRRIRLCTEAAPFYIRHPTSRRDREAIQKGETLEGFHLVGRIYVAGRPKLSLMTRQRPSGRSRAFQAEDHESWFDREMASPWVPVGGLYRPLVNHEPDCPGGRPTN
ncbi:MAG: glycosyltransferase family 39 protein [Chloroflexota bacterium]|nr:glycosyltransferase family 39 protein [Chloroflexota bacterium]